MRKKVERKFWYKKIKKQGDYQKFCICCGYKFGDGKDLCIFGYKYIKFYRLKLK